MGGLYGVIINPFSHRWSIAAHKHDLTEPEMQQQAAAKAISQIAGQ
jgi:hypothetical protein